MKTNRSHKEQTMKVMALAMLTARRNYAEADKFGKLSKTLDQVIQEGITEAGGTESMIPILRMLLSSSEIASIEWAKELLGAGNESWMWWIDKKDRPLADYELLVRTALKPEDFGENYR